MQCKNHDCVWFLLILESNLDRCYIPVVKQCHMSVSGEYFKSISINIYINLFCCVSLLRPKEDKKVVAASSRNDLKTEPN